MASLISFLYLRFHPLNNLKWILSFPLPTALHFSWLCTVEQLLFSPYKGAGDGFHGDGDDSAQMWTSLIFVLHLELPTSIPHGAPKQFYCLLAINSLEFWLQNFPWFVATNLFIDINMYLFFIESLHSVCYLKQLKQTQCLL